MEHREDEKVVTTGTSAATEGVAVTAEVESGFSKLSWRSIFGGTFAALGVWLLLGAFGLAIGLSAVSPQDPSLRGVDIWLGVWALIVPILAMFVGTLVATRSSAALHRSTGILYGVVVWGVTSFLGAAFLLSTTRTVVGSSLSAASDIIGGVGSGAVAAVQGGGQGGGNIGQAAGAVANFLNIDRSDLVRAVNQELQQRGRPTIEPQQLQTALQDAANTALRQGSLSPDILVNSLAQHTNLEREDINQIATQIQNQWNETVGAVTGALSQVTSTARNAALSTLDAIGKGFWFLFGSQLLGLIAALGAGILATSGPMKPGAAERAPLLRWRPAPART